MYNGYKGNKYLRSEGGGVSSREQRLRARSRRGGVSENWIVGSAVASLFFLTAIAIAIAQDLSNFTKTRSRTRRVLLSPRFTALVVNAA
jgi:hypothetical protein